MTEKQEPFELKVDDRRFKETDIEPSTQTDLVLVAMQKGYEPAFIEKMMGLQERFEANEARKAYHQAMSEFKKNPPKIFRDKKVDYMVGNKQTKWSHADLGVAADQINQALGECDLNSTWKTEQLENSHIKVTCTITHKSGHGESTFLIAPPDTSGSKNTIQAIGSTVFYLERYTLFAATGLAPVGMDDDGQGSGKPVEYINLDMQTEINDLIKSTKADKAKVLEYLGAKSVETILLSEYGKAKIAFAAKKKAPMRKPGEE